MINDPFAPLDGATPGRAPASSEKPAWVPVLPVPADAPAPPASHPKLGKGTLTWTYRDAAGDVLGYVRRFDEKDGSKVFRPLIYARPEAGGPAQWRWESWPLPRPLYGLHGLAERPSASVVVCEGEKAADAAGRLLPAHAVVTSPNGSKSAGKADWSPLAGRRVTIWPDADTAGLNYATAVTKAAYAAGAIAVSIVSPPAGVKVGWDAADAEVDGWSRHDTASLITGAALADRNASNSSATSKTSDASQQSAPPGRKRVPQRDILIGCTEFVELWHDANRIAYGTFKVEGHRENWPIRSRDFRMWLSGRYFETTGGAIGGHALEDGIRVLEARAVNASPQHEPCVRVGAHGGKLYLDLCHDDWRAIEITGDGWKPVEKPPLKLMRSTSMRALVLPEAGGQIEEFRRFCNSSDEDFMMIVAWLVAALRNTGPYTVLVLNGEAGTGKSIFSRMLRSLIDPAAAPIRAAPKDDRDLVISAGNLWVMVYDNISAVPVWLSDALARLSTGSGFSTRMLHTDNAEMIFEASRPIILNGIPSLTDRGDLAERAITIHLRAIPENERKPEDELWAEFEAARPRLIGALLDAVSAALRNIESVELPLAPRMADFLKWITAAESGLGWEPGAFYETYTSNRRDVLESAFEADAVAVGIRDFILKDYPVDGWEGTPARLLEELNLRASEGIKKARSWPLTAQGLGNRIDRIAQLLRNKGFVIERRRSAVRTIIIKAPQEHGDEITF